jgi:hypothetical protein
MDLFASFCQACYFLRELSYGLSGLLFLRHPLAGFEEWDSLDLRFFGTNSVDGDAA